MFTVENIPDFVRDYLVWAIEKYRYRTNSVVVADIADLRDYVADYVEGGMSMDWLEFEPEQLSQLPVDMLSRLNREARATYGDDVEIGVHHVSAQLALDCFDVLYPQSRVPDPDAVFRGYARMALESDGADWEKYSRYMRLVETKARKIYREIVEGR